MADSVLVGALRDVVSRVARSDVGVLLRGEHGVGKDLMARELHGLSVRRARAFVKVDCAALSPQLLESKFDHAHLGTILFDEVGDLPPSLQAKLLRTLQDHHVTHGAGTHPLTVDVRVLATTSDDLDAMMSSGQFRPDLYYRLQVMEIHVPPLRERRDDIPGLAQYFLDKAARDCRRPPVSPSPQLLAALAGYSFPGNVRELENMMTRVVVLQDETTVIDRLTPARAPHRVAAAVSARVPVEHEAFGRELLVDGMFSGIDLPALVRSATQRAEREAIDHALARFHWNRRKAAEYLHVSYKTLLNKIKECGITESDETGASGASHATAS